MDSSTRLGFSGPPARKSVYPESSRKSSCFSCSRRLSRMAAQSTANGSTLRVQCEKTSSQEPRLVMHCPARRAHCSGLSLRGPQMVLTKHFPSSIIICLQLGGLFRCLQLGGLFRYRYDLNCARAGWNALLRQESPNRIRRGFALDLPNILHAVCPGSLQLLPCLFDQLLPAALTISEPVLLQEFGVAVVLDFQDLIEGLPESVTFHIIACQSVKPSGRLSRPCCLEICSGSGLEILAGVPM